MSPGSPSSRRRTSTRCWPSWTRHGCGSRRSTREPTPLIWLSGEQIDAAFATIAAITGLKSPWLREHSTSGGRPRRGRGLAHGTGCRRPSPSCGGPRSRRTSAASASPMRSGRSRERWASASGSACVCTPTTASERSRSHRSWPRSGGWPAHTMSASMAPATIAAPGDRSSTRPLASWPPPTATPRCARRVRTARHSTPTRRRSSCCASHATDGSTRTPSRPVLEAAGHHVAKRTRERPAGLTPREVEVLLALVRRGVEPGHRRRPRHLRQDRRSPRAAHLREGWRAHSRRSDAVGLRAGPRPPPHRAFARCASGCTGQILASTSVTRQRRRDAEEADRCFWLRRRSRTSTDSRRSSRPRAPRSAAEHGSKGATVFRDPNERGPRLGALRLGRWRAGESSPPTPRSRRSCGSRPQGQAPGRRARRPLPRLGSTIEIGGTRCEDQQQQAGRSRSA